MPFEYHCAVSPILLNIPHASINLHNVNFLIDNPMHEAKFMADLYTDEIFKSSDYNYIVSQCSRIVVDTERYADDQDEEMSKYGMGAIYTLTSDKMALKKHDSALLDRFYYPYHKCLSDLASKTMLTHKHTLLVDCHSFPSIARYYEMQGERDMDICIGFNTYDEYVEHIVDLAKRHFKNVALNNPFAGSIVPNNLTQNEHLKLTSVMIEINRRLYMNETTFEKSDNFEKVKNDIQALLKDIGRYWTENISQKSRTL